MTVPIYRELAADKQRKTQIQIRGNWQNLGDEVTAAVPAAWHPLPKDAPRNRLTLAQWLMADGHMPSNYSARQGTALGRAGQVLLSQDAQGQVWVGGDVVGCIEGNVLL